MTSTIQVRVDEELKSKSDKLFRELGTDTTTAIRIFLTQAVAHNGFPFEIRKETDDPYRFLTEDMLLKYLELARDDQKNGRFKDADDIVSEMRDKYGL